MLALLVFITACEHSTVRSSTKCSVYDKDGYKYICKRDGDFWYWEYYGPNNKKIANIKYFDNGPDYYSDGIRRIVGRIVDRKKRYGYITNKNKIILKPTYEFAWQFSNGYGRVCKDVTFEKMGEHTAVNCGKVGLVNKQGKLVLPVKYNSINVKDKNSAEVTIREKKSVVSLN